MAYYQARRNKRNTINQLEFEINYESNLIQLYEDIINRVYVVKPSICFIINKPVKREIFAAHFRDRVVQHLVFNYINPTFEEQFIEDSYSCRKGKGTHYGVQRLSKAIKECSENYTQDCYILKLDIQGYFMSIDKNILQQKLTSVIDNAASITLEIKKTSAYLITTILADNPTKNATLKGSKSNWNGLPKSKSLFGSKTNCGLPIGNLTSQLFSNIYLHSFDCFVKNEKKIRYYGRYVDDFYIIDTNSDFLKKMIQSVRHHLSEELGLTLHPNKIFFQHYTKGVNYLGATIKSRRIYVSNRTKNNFKQCITKWELFLQNNTPTLRNLYKMRAAFNSYLGIMKHYSTYNIRFELLISNRNKYLYNYGYIESVKYKKMNYRLYKLY
jgi:RNA-directed DNA polymerase